MKHWGRICLICLAVMGCASEKKIAPTEGRLPLVEQVPLETTKESPKLDKAREISINLISGSNAQNKAPHYLIKETKKNWKEDAGKGLSGDILTLPSVLVAQKEIYTLDSQFNFHVFDLEGKKISDKKLVKNEKGLAFTAKNGQFYALSPKGTLIATNKDGKVQWQKTLEAPFRNEPVIYKDIIYLLSADNDVWALNTKNGKEIWHYKTTAPLTTLWGMGRPVVNNNIIVVPFSNGLVTAFDAQNGTYLWEEDMSGDKSFNQIDNLTQMIASPVAEENSVYLAGHANITKALNLKTGKEIWSVKLGSQTTPLISGNALFILDNQNTIHALNKLNGKQFWQRNLPLIKGKTSLALINNKLVVFVKDQTIILDVNTGKIEKNTVSETKANQPTITQNGLYYLTENGSLIYQGSLE